MKSLLFRWRAGRVESLGVAVVGLVLAIGAAQVSLGPRHLAAVMCALLIVVWLALALVLVPWRHRAARRAEQLAVVAELPPEHLARGKRLRQALRSHRWTKRIVSLSIVVVLGLTPAGAGLVDLVSGPFGGSWVAQVVAITVILTANLVVETAALGPWAHRVQLRFGLSTQSWTQWTIDAAKATVVAGVLTCVLLLALYGSVRLSPDWWWAWATAAAFAVSALLTFVYPVLIAPIFNKFSPLEPGALRDRLLALADKGQVTVGEVYVADASRRTRMINAAVAGYGHTRRVIIFDTLLRPDSQLAPNAGKGAAVEGATSTSTQPGPASESEIATIVAHELAHAKHHDVVTSMLLGVVRMAGVFAALYVIDGWSGLLHMAGVESLTDPRGFALLAIIMGIVVLPLNPVSNLISRRLEARADRFALDLTHDPVAWEQVWRRFVETNLAEPLPSRLRILSSTHPSIADRIATARAYASGKPSSADAAAPAESADSHLHASASTTTSPVGAALSAAAAEPHEAPASTLMRVT